MKIKIKVIALMIVLMCALSSFTSCKKGNNTDGKDGETYSVVIYKGRATGKSEGSDDQAVTDALEEKFYQDRGIKIDLQIKIYNGDDLTQKINTALGNKRVAMDVFGNTVSGNAGSSLVYDYGKDVNGSTKKVGSLLEKYGQHILAAIRENDPEHIVERTGYISIKGDFQLKLIPTVYHGKSYGLMVRKDYWKRAFEAGKTSLNPENYDISNNDYENLTIDEFESVMRAIKETVDAVSTPITGFAWDLERTIGASLGEGYLNMYKDSDGDLFPKDLSEGYAKLLDYLYSWSKEGLWEKDSLQQTDDDRLGNFLVGKNAAYIVYPDVENLITVARRLSTVDSDSKCMLVAPFKVNDGNGNYSVRGFYEQNPCFQGLALPYDGNNSEVFIQFLDWMYENPDNYEMAKYGIKGKHWIDGPDYTWTINEKTYTYKTWQYPAAKMAEYSKKAPYSGIWEEVLRNVNISDRLNNAWTPVEKNWYIYATNVCEGYSEKEMYGYLLPELPRTIDKNAYSEQIMYATYTRDNAFAGRLYNGITPSGNIETYRKAIKSGSREYLDWYKQQYKAYSDFYAEKFGSSK